MRTAAVISFIVFILGTAAAFPKSSRTAKTRDQILELLVKENTSIQECVDQSGGVDRTFQMKEVDLSDGEPNAIMVRGIAPCVCGPRKCLNRIYRPAGDRLELLLSADFAQAIEPQPLYTNSYRNLWAAVYMYHSFTSVLYEYQYDGQHYKWDHCVMRFYYYPETVNGKPFSGRVRYHDQPSISWVGCNPINPYGP